MSGHILGKRFITSSIELDKKQDTSELSISKDNYYTIDKGELDTICEGRCEIIEEATDFVIAEFNEKDPSKNKNFIIFFEFISPESGYLKIYENKNFLKSAYFKTSSSQ